MKLTEFLIGQKVKTELLDGKSVDGYVTRLHEKGERVVYIPVDEGYVHEEDCKYIEMTGINLREAVEEAVKESLEKFDPKKVINATPEDREEIYQSIVEEVGEDSKGNEEEIKDMVDGYFLQADIDSGKKTSLEAVSDYIKDEYKLTEAGKKEIDGVDNLSSNRLSKKLALLGEKILANIDLLKGTMDDNIEDFIIDIADDEERELCEAFHGALEVYLSRRLGGGRTPKKREDKVLALGALEYQKKNRENKKEPVEKIENGEEYSKLKEAANEKFNEMFKKIKSSFEPTVNETPKKIDIDLLIDEFEKENNGDDFVKFNDAFLLEYICNRLGIDPNEVLEKTNGNPTEAILSLY